MTENPQAPLQMKQESKAKGIADIVFCIDTSGSIEPCIQGIKNQIDTFLANLESIESGLKLDWTARVVGFRDVDEDGPYAFVGMDNDFVTTVTDVKTQLDMLEAKGGGDNPESGLDALYTIAKVGGWREVSHRTVILFSDDKAKEQLSELTIDAAQNESRDVSTLMQLMAKEEISVNIFAPMSEPYATVAGLPKSYMKPDIVLDETRHTGLQNLDFQGILEKLAKTIAVSSKVVAKTKGATPSSGQSE